MLDRYDHNLILDYIEGDLSPSERAGFEQLLVQDRELQVLVDAMIADRQLLREMPLEQAPRDVMERVQQRMERNMLLDAVPLHAEDMAVRRRFRIGRLIAYGSLAAMLLVSALLMYRTLAPWNGQTPIEQLAMHNAEVEKELADRGAVRNGAAGRSESLAAASTADTVAKAADTAADTPPADVPSLAKAVEGAGARAVSDAPAKLAEMSPSPEARALAKADQPDDPVPLPQSLAIPEGQPYAMLQPQGGPGRQAEAARGEQAAMLAATVPSAQSFAQATESASSTILFNQAQHLRVQTTNTEATQAALEAWSQANAVSLVASDDEALESSADDAVRQFVLLVRTDQLPDLIGQLQQVDEAEVRIAVTNVSLPTRQRELVQEPGDAPSGRQPQLPPPAHTRAMPALPEGWGAEEDPLMRHRAWMPPPGAIAPRRRARETDASEPGPAGVAVAKPAAPPAESQPRQWGMLLLPQLPLSATLSLDRDITRPVVVRIEPSVDEADGEKEKPTDETDKAEPTSADLPQE